MEKSIVKKQINASTIHELVQKSCTKYSKLIALSENGNDLSYEMLEQKSNILANYLKNLNVKPDTVIGIYMDRSIESIISMIGILKAGGAYLPLDPHNPIERTQYIISDSEIKIVLTQSNYADSIPDNVKIIIFDEYDFVGSESFEIGDCGCTEDNLAYVIYTSGSTGKPKGVEITHKSVVNLLNSFEKIVNIDTHDKMIALTTLSFDIAVLEIFLPLSVGATIEIANRIISADGALLSNFIDRKNITYMQATPVTWKLLIESGWKGKSDLKALCGGEALSKQLAKMLINRCNSLWNVYGPTETTVWSSALKVGKADAITIGQPIQNTTFHVLDESLNTVEDGDKGELYIGGMGLARGYCNNDELTDEKFIYHSDFGRIYKTGDLVKSQSNNLLEYLGRTDFQVKIRGFRIELGEIEQVATNLSYINQCVAIVKEAEDDTKSIVLFFIPDEEIDLSINNIKKELKETLKQSLPEYMLPSYYVSLKSFPTTANQKIDRKALSGMLHDQIDRSGISPETDMEKEIASIWSKFLKIDDIMLDNHFLDLGGHSLLANRIVVKINKRYNIKLTLLDFLTYGMTISGLVEFIENKLLLSSN